MPVVQKVKSLLSRKNSIPEAPVAPAAPLTQTAPVVAEPINNNTLLAQKEALIHDEALLNREANFNNMNGLNSGLNTGLNNGNVYNNLAGNELRNEEILAEESLLANQAPYIQSAQRASLTRAEPTILQTIEKDVVIQERIHPVMKEEIQPIIYREREQLDVRQVTQMMHETQIQPTLIEQRELPAETREAIIERAAPIPENIVLPLREVDAVERTQVVHAPIVEEVIKKTVIEEIQPVLERDVYQPTVIQNTQPIYEKVVEAPTVYREVRTVQELGTRGATDSYLAQETLLNSGYNNNLSSSSFEQRELLNQNLSNSSYEQQRLGNFNGQNTLPTGQVLPQIQSSRPAYAYLPSNYSEPRPQFMGTASQYVLAANGLPQNTLNHSKTLPTVYPLGMNQNMGAAPLVMNRQ